MGLADELDGGREQAGRPRFQASMEGGTFTFTKLENARGVGLESKHGFSFGQVHYVLMWLVGHLCGESQQIWNRSCWRQVATMCLLGLIAEPLEACH